jgi:hypothetical protein
MCVVGQSTVRVAMTLRPRMTTRTAAARRRGEAGASVRAFSSIPQRQDSLPISQRQRFFPNVAETRPACSLCPRRYSIYINCPRLFQIVSYEGVADVCQARRATCATWSAPTAANATTARACAAASRCTTARTAARSTPSSTSRTYTLLF